MSKRPRCEHVERIEYLRAALRWLLEHPNGDVAIRAEYIQLTLDHDDESAEWDEGRVW